MIEKNNRFNSIYLDACATTPINKEVLKEIVNIYENYFGNPSSLHQDGILASEILERSRLSIAKNINSSINDIVFTSGATESVNLAIKGIASSITPGRIVISSVEHPAVKQAALSLQSYGWNVDYWPVDKFGNIQLKYLEKYLEKPTRIVSIIWGQSDIGTIQPIQFIGNACRERGIIFHTDATQVFPHGLINWKDLPVNLLSASSHKLQGPKGVGILIKKNIKFKPQQLGGNQEHSLRAGTEPIALIAGMAKAISLIDNQLLLCEKAIEFPETRVKSLTSFLYKRLSEYPNIKLLGNDINQNRLPNHISILVGNKYNKPISSRLIVQQLSERGISCSSGSACKSGVTQDNDVLEAIKVNKEWRRSLIRLSLGPWLDYNNIEKIPTILNEVTSLSEHD